MYIKADQREQALQAVLKAIEPLRELTQLDAGNPQYERNLGVALAIAGESRVVLGEHEQAQKDLAQAIAILEDLAARYPGDADYAEHLETARQAHERLKSDSAADAEADE